MYVVTKNFHVCTYPQKSVHATCVSTTPPPKFYVYTCKRLLLNAFLFFYFLFFYIKSFLKKDLFFYFRGRNFSENDFNRSAPKFFDFLLDFCF